MVRLWECDLIAREWGVRINPQKLNVAFQVITSLYTWIQFSGRFKHLLGRSPDSAAEIAEHIQILVKQGFDAEVDSYLNSNE
ncbi:MAG: phycobilisome rod-core linker polypeptide [Cyanobacteria bacterium P01_F01_bin.116]